MNRYSRLLLQISSLIVLVACSSGDHNNKIPMLSATDTSESVLDALVEKLKYNFQFPSNSDKEAIKEKIKEWNPQIKDWARVGDGTPINLYKKSFKYDLFLNYKSNSNTDTFQLQETSQTTNIGMGGGLSLYYTLSELSYYYMDINYLFQKKISFLGRTYNLDNDFSIRNAYSNLSLDLGLEAIISYEYEQMNILGVDPAVDTTIQKIKENLVQNSITYHWIRFALAKSFSLSQRKSHIEIGVGYSPIVNSKINSSKTTFKATRLDFGFKIFFNGPWWFKILSNYYSLDNQFKSKEKNWLLQSGYLFD